jgi:hypothetical protein
MLTGPCSSGANKEKTCDQGVGSGGTNYKGDDRTEDIKTKDNTPEGDKPKDDLTEEEEEEGEEEEQNDLRDQSLLKLPPELRLEIYGYVFDSALDSDKPLNPKACFPVPPIVLAWPELKDECGTVWRRRLSDESTRLSCYQCQLDDMDRPGSKRWLTSEEADAVYEEFERTLLKQKQVEVLLNNYDAGTYGTAVVKHCMCVCCRLLRGRQQRPWSLDAWNNK